MNRIKENAQKLTAAGLVTDFAMAFSSADIDRLAKTAQETIDEMMSTFGLVDAKAQQIIDQAEQAKAILFNV